jgi:hypothetical protein
MIISFLYAGQASAFDQFAGSRSFLAGTRFAEQSDHMDIPGGDDGGGDGTNKGVRKGNRPSYEDNLFAGNRPYGDSLSADSLLSCEDNLFADRPAALGNRRNIVFLPYFSPPNRLQI